MFESNTVCSILILLTYYFFGNFGLFNLFDIRNESQLIVLLLLFSFVLIKKRIYNIKAKTVILYFFTVLFFIGAFARSNSYPFLIYLIICVIIIYLLGGYTAYNLTSLLKLFTLTSFILCIPVMFTFMYYFFNIAELQSANFEIYTSQSGSTKAVAKNLFDYFCFTSGDGFTFFSYTIPRVKGYCSEPSSTFMYYLMPSIFGFLLSLKYRIISTLSILINVICIGSFSCLLVILFGLFFFLIMKITFFNRLKYIVLFVLLITITNFSLTSRIAYYIVEIIPVTNILSKKISSSEDGSLHLRGQGIENGFKMIFTKPLGYNSQLRVTGSGLLFLTSSYSGILGISLLLIIIISIFNAKNYSFIDIASYATNYQFYFSLLISSIFFSLFVNGYAWDRPSGLIMLYILFYMNKSHVLRALI